jgi:hypothetical protein
VTKALPPRGDEDFQGISELNRSLDALFVKDIWQFDVDNQLWYLVLRFHCYALNVVVWEDLMHAEGRGQVEGWL